VRLALIGYGAIANLMLETLARTLPSRLDLLLVLAREGRVERAERMAAAHGAQIAGRTLVTSSFADALAHDPDLVVEAAGHQALQQFGPATLGAGVDLIVASAGALADDALRNALDATSGPATYDIISGAIGGLDLLAAARLSGLHEVTYIGRKPPAAWRGTAAEDLVRLDGLTQATTIFHGDAGAAALAYPRNANVAATIAIKGAGFRDTRVELIADPHIARNVHEVRVRAACADFHIRIDGHATPDNPKTSLSTAYSLASAVLQYMRTHRKRDAGPAGAGT